MIAVSAALPEMSWSNSFRFEFHVTPRPAPGFNGNILPWVKSKNLTELDKRGPLNVNIQKVLEYQVCSY